MAEANTMFREEIYKISKNNDGSVLPLYVLYHIYNEKLKHMSEWLQALSYNDYLSNSIIFKALSNKVNERNLISDAAIFPEFIFQFLGNQKGTISSSQLLTSKYTLIEFWFAKCGACIRQFDTFMDIYETSSIFRENINMVMVTIDDKKYAEEAEQISKKYHENWLNLWDIDGKIADELSINAFPFNVLLNKKGEVLKTNVEPYELLEILKSTSLNPKKE
jgi:hypothetical protein